MTAAARSGILVLKFGGTALATPGRVRAAAARIAGHLRYGRSVVAVVSARGTTTDVLLRFARILGPGSASAGASERDEMQLLRSREVDRLLATGEDRSAALLAIALAARGVPARSLRGGEAGIRAEGPFGGGGIRHVATSRLRRVMAGGVVPIVSGFQGEKTDGETVTLGRGASDATAVALAAALDAECHIITDVAGVYDQDPARHTGPRQYERLAYAGLLALVESGAQVVHPAAAGLAASAAVPLRVYHFRAPLSGRTGTIIDAGSSTSITEVAT